MKKQRFRRHTLAALAAAVALAMAGAAHAQLSTSTLRGQINSGTGTTVATGTVVTAVNRDNGNTWRTTTLDDGNYVFTGLAPGPYEIRVAGPGGSVSTEQITLRVGDTAQLDLQLSGSQQITIVGSAERRDVKTSEVGTNVSRRQIEILPQQTRNFLSSADLAPGVAFTTDGAGYARLQSGSQNLDHVNVFIDGIGQKNNVLSGGITGQNSSRGNPFPQSAIAEYKVLTQNYKAEFEQVSSAAITAVTRSGTNEFHGDAYIDRTGTNWRAQTRFEKEREAQGVTLPSSSKKEYGVSLGGPIVRDRVHFFGAYDGKDIDDSRQVVPRNLNQFQNQSVGILPRLVAAQGSQVDTFKEHLFFGKIDAQLGEDQRLTASVKIRREDDKVPEDRDLSLPGNDKNRINDETRVDVLHEWSRGPLLNELRLGYEDANWNPQSASNAPYIKYKVSTEVPPRWNAAQDVIFEGGSPDAQKRQQEALYIGNDITWTGLARHVFKGGVKLKAMEYDLSGTSRSVPIVEVTIDRITGLPYFDGTNCTGDNLVNGPSEQTTIQCRLQRPLAPATANFKNRQLGLYFQDDWSVTKQLEVNLGLRWDYESNMLNNDYVTPPDRLAALRGIDGRTIGGPNGPIVAPPGQTYAQSLAKGGINIEDYIADGNQREPFKKAFAPRVGASYDIFGNRNTVLFGGWGRSYDRTIANHALDELQKNQQAGGEIWLIKNDIKLPYADQASFGVRQGFGVWNTELTLSSVRAKDQFVWFVGNRDPNGGFGNQSPIDPLFGGPAGYGTLILGDFGGKTKTDSVFLKVEKPYTQASGWQFNVAYTYSDAQTTHRTWDNDIFDFTYLKPGEGGYKPSVLVDRHRVVVSGLADTLLPWGLGFSGKAVYGSGFPRRLTDCSTGFSNCVYRKGDAPSFRQIDLSLFKSFQWGMHAFTLKADVFNVLNTQNYGGFEDFIGGPGKPQNEYGGDNPNLGKPTSIRGDPRTLRVALSYRF